MQNDLRTLGDPLDGDDQPVDWKFGHRDDARIDLLLVGGHSTIDELDASFVQWRGDLEPHWELVHLDYGRRREDDKEFFGFNDGISQPAMRGKSPLGDAISTRYIEESDSRSKEFAKPGQRLIWPGNFIFGYEREVSGSTPGAVFDPPQPWMKNGSYLVYRRLNQDTEAFENALKTLAEFLAARGIALDPAWLGSRLVGRWKDDSPVMVSPDTPSQDLGKDAFQNNNFQYQFREAPLTIIGRDGNPRVVPATPADPLGRVVPKSAHIRQMNPRAGQSEKGSEVHPLKLMLRRGVTFGPEVEDDPTAERGLIFMSYQTSIVRQFLFVQSTWANSANAPASVGIDPLIGQDGSEGPQRTVSLPDTNGSMHRCPFNGRWVVPTAGGYFFTPGIDGLREISRQMLIAGASLPTKDSELMQVKGIGLVFGEKLASVGITRLTELAALSETGMEHIDQELGISGRAKRERWVAQAQDLIRNSET